MKDKQSPLFKHYYKRDFNNNGGNRRRKNAMLVFSPSLSREIDAFLYARMRQWGEKYGLAGEMQLARHVCAIFTFSVSSGITEREEFAHFLPNYLFSLAFFLLSIVCGLESEKRK